MTPPLIVRDRDGLRSIIEVDDVLNTVIHCQSNRTIAFLALAPGLTVHVKSRCVNKRRITVLVIGPARFQPGLDNQLSV